MSNAPEIRPDTVVFAATNGARDVWVHRVAMLGLVLIGLGALGAICLIEPTDQGARAGTVAIGTAAVTGLVGALRQSKG